MPREHREKRPFVAVRHFADFLPLLPALVLLPTMVSCGLVSKAAVDEQPVSISVSMNSNAVDFAHNKARFTFNVAGSDGSRFDAAIAPLNSIRDCRDNRMERQRKDAIVPARIELTTTYVGDPSGENRLVCLYAKKENGSDRPEVFSVMTGSFASPASQGTLPERSGAEAIAPSNATVDSFLPTTVAAQPDATSKSPTSAALQADVRSAAVSASPTSVAAFPDLPSSPRIDSTFQVVTKALRLVTFSITQAESRLPPHKPVFDGRWNLSTKIPVCDSEPYGTVLRYLFPQSGGVTWKGGPISLCTKDGSILDSMNTAISTTSESSHDYSYGLVSITKGNERLNVFIQRNLVTLSTGTNTTKIVDFLSTSTEFEKRQTSADATGSMALDLTLAGIRVEAIYNQPHQVMFVIPGRDSITVTLTKLH